MIIMLLKNPKDSYICSNGRHFNEKLCDYAVSLMYTNKDSKKLKLVPITKEQLDTILNAEKISIKDTSNYDYVYVANMCRADFLGSSITDTQHMCLFVKDMIEDIDAYDGYIFDRWKSDMKHLNIQIDWNNMI